jgi:hypothetical protein
MEMTSCRAEVAVWVEIIRAGLLSMGTWAVREERAAVRSVRAAESISKGLDPGIVKLVGNHPTVAECRMRWVLGIQHRNKRALSSTGPT